MAVNVADPGPFQPGGPPAKNNNNNNNNNKVKYSPGPRKAAPTKTTTTITTTLKPTVYCLLTEKERVVVHSYTIMFVMCI